MNLHMSLLEYASRGKTVCVGLLGAGQMGEGLIRQMECMTAMSTVIAADIQPGRAKQAFLRAKVPAQSIVETDNLEIASQAVTDGLRVATTDPALPSRIESLDIIVEATGIPEVGASAAHQAILCRKHVLQMNVEADATVGYLLRKMAKSAGVVYTLTAGDEPGATMELFDFANTLGFEIICAGKGKNNPLDRTANPDIAAIQAEAQEMNPKMLASFIDGTKTMVEMTSFGNAVGFVPDVVGMNGPEVSPKDIARVFCPRSEGGILTNRGVVEYGLGIAPGVFVVFTTDNPGIAKDLGYLHLGKGPYWALYRPFHLASIETPISILKAVLKNETTIATDIPPVAETVAYAKTDLKSGTVIDGLGGFTVYGIIEQSDFADRNSHLPLGLAPGCIVKNDMKAGVPICYGDVELDGNSTILQLRRIQDNMLGRGKQ